MADFLTADQVTYLRANWRGLGDTAKGRAIILLLDSLGATTSGAGASQIGIFDTAGNFTATDVEGALAEILSDLALTTSGNGASLVGVQDANANYSTATVEGALNEVGPLSTTGQARDDVNSTQGMARCVYDFSADGGAVGIIQIGPSIPDNAFVTYAHYEVLTTFTSSGDSATISLGFATDDVAGIVAATAISGVGDIWDAGHQGCIQDDTPPNFSNQLTAARQVDLTIAVENVTAGKLTLYVHYVIGA